MIPAAAHIGGFHLHLFGMLCAVLRTSSASVMVTMETGEHVSM